MIGMMDREKRLVLEDANGLRTYFYVFPSAPPAEPGGRESGDRSGSRASRPSGIGTFFNSRLVGLLAAEAGGGEADGHSRFVAAYASILADAMGIRDHRTLAGIERGALLHDIGKAGVPASILNKPGALTAIEREIVREHPVLGYKMTEGLGFLEEAGEIILCHHERFDGTGYPRGLAGRSIPLVARVFALADTLDAITSDRPYRKGWRFEEALREIGRASGRQFDPAVVDVFLSIPVSSWRQARTDVRFPGLLPSVN
jgi:putative nucleotidyltransferase with HDIG domain